MAAEHSCGVRLSASGACSTAHRLNRPDHWDGLMLDRSAVGQLSSLSSRTKWQRLPAGDTLPSVSPAGNRCHFVLSNTPQVCISETGLWESPFWYRNGQCAGLRPSWLAYGSALQASQSWHGTDITTDEVEICAEA